VTDEGRDASMAAQEVDPAAETVEVSTVDETAEIGLPATEVEAPDDSDRPRRRRRLPRAVVPAVLAVLLVASGAVATWLYFKQFRPEQLTDQSVENTVAKAATDGTVALLSYSPDSLDQDFAAARSHLSGGFLDYYNQFTEQIVAPAAKQKALKTTASVKGAAVSQLKPDSAVVLVLVDQSTTSKDNPNPSTASSAVLVSMVRADRNWLISKFEPIG
jgi:Mce-associated membrane protein